MPIPPRLSLVTAAFVVVAMFLSSTRIASADEDVEPTPSRPDSLHFTHPQVAESPLPDNKLRLDYSLTKLSEDGDAKNHTVTIEGEYAPVRWVSLLVYLPYTFADRDEAQNRHNLDDMTIAVKLASFAFEEREVLVGGGVEVEAPTGNSDNDIGSDRLVVIQPFLDFGVKRGRFEAVGFLDFGIPANENDSDPDWSIGANLSLLAHFSYMMAGLVEFDLERAYGGDVENETVVNMSPGFRWNPSDDPNLWFGTNLSFPLTNDDEFDLRWQLTAFYHF